jgi:hypothetical protein
MLRTHANRLNPLSAAELHSNLFLSYTKIVQDSKLEREVVTSFPAPLYRMISGNSRLLLIFLSPITTYNPLRISYHDDHPLLQMSKRLSGDKVDIDSSGYA